MICPWVVSSWLHIWNWKIVIRFLDEIRPTIALGIAGIEVIEIELRNLKQKGRISVLKDLTDEAS